MPAVITETDRLYLQRALELAERGRGRVSPNPLVGAVLVRDDEVIGEGWHAEIGGLHAERAALADCRERGHDPAGATMFVTLEPCAHHGRQPPCTEALVEARVARVVYAADDPSDKASGRGPGVLRDEGIEAVAADGPEASAARLQNQAFRKHARAGRPLVTYKAAVTLDGRTATASGDSQWISGPTSRALVHRWRSEADAVAVGIGTALADDPLLTARDAGPAARQPVRVVFDSRARLPLAAKLVRSLDVAPLILFAGRDADPERTEQLREAGVEVAVVSGEGPDRVAAALSELGRRGITSLLLEGGAELAGAFFEAGEIDDVKLFVAPKLLGGADARPLLAGAGAQKMAEALPALSLESEQSGEDILIKARLREW